jgi:hypothetical protein
LPTLPVSRGPWQVSALLLLPRHPDSRQSPSSSLVVESLRKPPSMALSRTSRPVGLWSLRFDIVGEESPPKTMENWARSPASLAAIALFGSWYFVKRFILIGCPACCGRLETRYRTWSGTRPHRGCCAALQHAAKSLNKSIRAVIFRSTGRFSKHRNR